MPAPTTNVEFVDFVRKSGLIHQERLDAFLDKHGTLDGDPSKIALALIQEGLLTNFQARQLLRGRYRGFAIGKYLLLEQLGEGGMGKVFLCEHMLMRRRVAIKVLTRELAADPGTIERFQREARAVASLDHPNIVRAHDVDCEGENHFIVMEYVDGNSLHEVVRKKGPLDARRAAHYMRQAAVGLQAVMDAGMIHRDIKPGNLLLDRKGTVKILDLGLARFDQDKRDAITQQFDEGSVLGTADYLSPEQAMNSHSVDIRADLYSLGATFYFLLTGRPPFEGGTVTQKLLYHQLRDPEPLARLRPDLPAELIAVVDKMMAKDPANRYQTPNEIIAALEPFTREAIPPPTEDEMPRLCLAAQRAGTPDAGPLPNLQALSAASASTVTRASSSVDTPRGLTSSSVAQRGRASVPPPFDPRLSGPRSERSGSGLAMMTGSHSGVHSSSRVGLGESSTKIHRTGGSSTSIRGRSSRIYRRRRRRWAAVVAVLAFVGLLVAGGYYFLGGPPKKKEQVLVVSRTAKGPHVYKTIAEAWAKRDANRPGRILIQEKNIEENVRLIGRPDGNDPFWSIEGNAAGDAPSPTAPTSTQPGSSQQTVTWRTADMISDRPLLHIENVPNLTLINFRFEAGERTNDLVVIAGNCQRMQVRSVSFRNVRRTGLTLLGAYGGNPLFCRITSAQFYPSAEAQAGVLLHASSQFRAPLRNIHMLGLEFFSDEKTKARFNTGIQVAAQTEAVRIGQCTFDGCESAIAMRRIDQPFQPFNLTLTGNTFKQNENALRFELLDRMDLNNIKAENNTFVAVPRLSMVEDFPESPPVAAKWIWHAEPASPGSAPATGPRWFRARFKNTGTGRKAALDLTAAGAAVIWLNNRKIGELPADALTSGRVASFDVSNDLLDGDNVLAVMVQGDAKSSAKAPQALLCHLAAGPGSFGVLLASDARWRSSNKEVPGWTTAMFNDDRWTPVAVLGDYGRANVPWKKLVWDSEIKARFGGRLYSPILNPTGNVRDDESNEGFPSFASAVLDAGEIDRRLRPATTTSSAASGTPIAGYLIAGPFDGGFTDVLPPERKADPHTAYSFRDRTYNWEEMRPRPGSGGKVDLAALYGKVSFTAYALVWIEAPSDQEVELMLNYDDAAKVWLDDRLIFEKDERSHGMDQPATPIKVQLNKGPNKLLFKIVNYQGESGLACRIRATGRAAFNFTHSLKAPALPEAPANSSNSAQPGRGPD